MSRQAFPILGTDISVPYAFVEQFERRLDANHRQSVERLAERGGLDWSELFFAMHDKPFPPTSQYNSEHPFEHHVRKAVADWESNCRAREIDAAAPEGAQAVAWRYRMPLGGGLFTMTRWLDMDEPRPKGCKIEYAYAAPPSMGGEDAALREDAERWRWVAERAWFVDAAAHVYDLRFGPGDFSTEPHDADADDVRAAIDAARAEEGKAEGRADG